MLTRILQLFGRAPAVAGMLATVLASSLMLSACGGGGNSASGEVVIGLTDAEGDYATYTVDVQSLTLTRQDGSVVETLPVSTRVDFAQYTDLTEFLTAATVPEGVYTKASMVLDYSNADIQVENADGDVIPVPIGNIVDLDGNPVTTLDMSVQLEDRDKLLLVPGLPAHMTLDFDLKASNSVEFGATDVTLTVEPFLVADVELDEPKPHRVRGPLESVDVTVQQFRLILRPFHHPIRDDRRFGVFTVKTTDDTVYEIDGVNYTGADGIDQMAALPQFTAVIAIGELKRVGERRAFVAAEVYAGSSVPGGDKDVAKGLVVARSGNTLTLKGASLNRGGGNVAYNDEVTVELAATTKVTKQLDDGMHDISEISVGQRLTVFGDISVDPAGNVTIDASNGLARMHLTTLRGVVAQQDAPLAVDLQSIGHRSASIFDFSGTGVNAANDADVDFYEINTGALDLSNVALDDPIKVRGFVRPFGTAPEDFDAQTLMLVGDARALMMVNWVPPSVTAISEVSESGITLDLTGVGRFHYVSRAGMLTDLTAQGNPVVLQPAADGAGVYVLSKPRRAQVFKNYTEFAREMANELGVSAVRSLQVVGKYDDSTATMTIRGMRIRLR